MMPQSGIGICHPGIWNLPSGIWHLAAPSSSALCSSLLLIPRRDRRGSPVPELPRDEQAAFRLADPGPDDRAGRRRAAGDQPGRHRLGRGRPPLRGRDDRLPGRARVGTDPAAGGPRRRRASTSDATVFAEGLPFPNGVLPCFGGVLVTAAPDIWFFRDNDGDGRADERRVVLTGFGEGNTQLRVNGLYWGLDNWIYAANGRSDGEVRTPGATRPSRPSRSAAATCDSGSGPSSKDVAGRGHRRLQPVRPGPRRLGQPLPLLEHDPHPPRRRSSRPTSTATRISPRPPRSPRSSTRPTAGGSIPSARCRPGSIASRSPTSTPAAARRSSAATGFRPPIGQRLRLRAPDEPGPPPRRSSRPGRTFVARRVERGSRVPGLDRPGLPPGQPGDRPGRGPLRRGHVPRAGRAPRLRPRGPSRRRRLPPLARPGPDLADQGEGRRHAGSFDGPATAPGQGERPRPRAAARPSRRLVARHGPAAAGRAPGSVARSRS